MIASLPIKINIKPNETIMILQITKINNQIMIASLPIKINIKPNENHLFLKYYL